jgi:glycosyltransferase involved in cell wall biosynthesis
MHCAGTGKQLMISVIVPSCNTERTLGACLEAIFDSHHMKFEVIVVDDASADTSVHIAQQYPCRIIRLKKRKGLSHARNTGVQYAQYKLLVFIDADVVVRPDTLSTINRYLNEHDDAAGVVGLLDEHCPYKDFFSQYKNLYMNFIFNRISSPINFFYGSVHAMRAEHFQSYDESLPFAEDTELGLRLSADGKHIVLLDGLLVTHLKRHTFISLVKNDFRIPFYWAHLFFRYCRFGDLFKSGRFAHASGSQIASLLIASAMGCALSVIPFASSMFLLIPGLLMLLFLFMNSAFMAFLFRKRGAAFGLRSIIFTLFDQMLMTSGVAVGALHHVVIHLKGTKLWQIDGDA